MDWVPIRDWLEAHTYSPTASWRVKTRAKVPMVVTVAGSARVHVRYRTHAEKTQKKFNGLFCDTGRCYGRGVLSCTCEV